VQLRYQGNKGTATEGDDENWYWLREIFGKGRQFVGAKGNQTDPRFEFGEKGEKFPDKK